MILIIFCDDIEIKKKSSVGLINPGKSGKYIIFYIGKNKFIDKISPIKKIVIGE